MATLAAIVYPTVLPDIRTSSSKVYAARVSPFGGGLTASYLKQNPSRDIKIFNSVGSSDSTTESTKSRSNLSYIISSTVLASFMFLNTSPIIANASESFNADDVRPAMATVDEDVDRDTYINMLQNIKSEEAPAVVEPVLTPEERAKQFKEKLEKKKKEAAEAKAKEDEEKKKKPLKEQKAPAFQFFKKEPINQQSQDEPLAPVLKASEQEKVGKPIVPVPAVSKQQSHGYLPLFLSQLLLTAGYAGIFVALFLVPDSVWKQVEQKKDALIEKAKPVVEETWEKVKPQALKAYSASQKFIEDAKPVVARTIEESKPIALKAYESAKPLAGKAIDSVKPLAGKAIESAKPLLEKGQVKVADLLSQVQSQVKSKEE